MEYGIDLGVHIRGENVHKVLKVGDGDREGVLSGEHICDMPLVYEVGVDQVGFPQLVTDEPDGQVMFGLIAVPETLPVTHLLALDGAHECKQSTLRM